MRSLVSLAILTFSLASLDAQTGNSDPGGVLSQLTVARFTGSGAQTIQAMTSDAAGNVYVAGTTSSPDLLTKNAAQPVMGDALLMRSTDRGVTWQRVPNPPTILFTIAPHPSDPKTLFVGGADGIYKTTDSGQSWRHVYTWAYIPPFNVVDVAIDPVNPRNIYVFTSVAPVAFQFLVSSDGGESWQPRAPAPFGGAELAGANLLWVDPNGSGTVGMADWLSRDHGVTWTRLSFPPGAVGGPSFIAPSPWHSGWIYEAINEAVPGALYVSEDWGTTWTELSSFSFGLMDLVFDPDNAYDLYASDTFSHLDISLDLGADWNTSSPTGFVDPGTRMAALSRRCGGGALLVISDESVVSSLDFGTTWQSPQLSRVRDVASGPGCAVYAVRSPASDAFIAKLAPNGEVLWSTFLGGSDADSAAAIAVDAGGNVYVTGNTSSADFPSTASRIGQQGRQNVFVTKFDSEGKIIYSVIIGGESTDNASSLAVNAQNEAHVAGWTSSKSFPVTGGAFQTEPGANDGFAVKLAASGTLIYASYLPNYGTYNGNANIVIPPEKAIVATEASGSALIGGYNGMFARLTSDGSSLTALTNQPGQILAMESDSQGDVYVAGQAVGAGVHSASCSQYMLSVPAGDIFVNRLHAEDLQEIYSARLFGDCQSWPNAMSVDSTGEVTLGLWTYDRFPTLNPALPFSDCGAGGNVVSRLSADGSKLLFSTFLDMCFESPTVAVGSEGAIYTGFVSGPYQTSEAGVLRIPVPQPAPPSIASAFNAFSGGAGFASPGMLLTVTGESLAPKTVDLGLNDPNPLPTALGGVQVLFDDVPAQMFQVAPDHVICVVPATVSNQAVTVQVISGSTKLVPFVLPAGPDAGLLTRLFPDLPAPLTSVDGNIRNADGSLNGAQNPAAPGSKVTLYATGLSGPGPVQLLWDAPPPQPYQVLSYLSGTARHMQGFIDAIWAIDFVIPDAPGPGVYVVPVPDKLTRHVIELGESSVGVWVN